MLIDEPETSAGSRTDSAPSVNDSALTTGFPCWFPRRVQASGMRLSPSSHIAGNSNGVYRIVHFDFDLPWRNTRRAFRLWMPRERVADFGVYGRAQYAFSAANALWEKEFWPCRIERCELMYIGPFTAKIEMRIRFNEGS